MLLGTRLWHFSPSPSCQKCFAGLSKLLYLGSPHRIELLPTGMHPFCSHIKYQLTTRPQNAILEPWVHKISHLMSTT